MTRWLLDTHILIWALEEERRLSPAVTRILTTAPQIFVSMATAWEMAMLINLGRLHVPGRIEVAVVAAGYTPLPILFPHIEAYAGLRRDDHRDPFDRMLVAQATAENMTLITEDRKLHMYDVEVFPPRTAA